MLIIREVSSLMLSEDRQEICVTDYISTIYCPSHIDTLLSPLQTSTTTNLHKFQELDGKIGITLPIEKKINIQKS